MAASTPNTQTNAETIPQIAMFISKSYIAPSPAPWPPLPPQQTEPPPVATAPPPPPPPPASPPRHAPALQPTQHPPSVTAPTLNAAQLRPTATSYSAMSPQGPSVLFRMTQPPPVVPPSFDASVPPPPIPTHLQPNNAQLKRKSDMNGNVGTSKRKLEGSELSDSHCESCIQRELRIDGYKQQMEVLHNEEEAQILLYKKKLQEYEIGRDLLKTIVGPELFSVFDKLIEGGQSPQLDNYASFNAGPSTVSKQALLHFFQMLLGGGTRTRSLIESVSSTSHVEETLSSLTSLRRHNVGSDLMKFLVETLRNSNGSNRISPDELLTNGQKEATAVSEPSRSGFGGAASYPAAAAAAAAAGPSGYSAPAPYPAFHPAVPPPARPPHYYTQTPGAPHSKYRINEMQPPTTSAVLRPSHTNTPNYYMATYPQPPYFPPYH